MTDGDHVVPGAEHRLRIGVLGALHVARGDQTIEVGPAMVRNLLGLLAAHPGRALQRDEIIRLLWPVEPPATCVNLVQGYVSRLRTQLGAGLDDPAGRAALVSREIGGYRLGGGDLDLARFDELRRGAARARADGAVPAALAAYEAALGCWRGPVLADLEPRLRQLPAAVAAHQRRADAAVEYADLCCSVGHWAQAIGALRQAMETAPLHEGLAARLMLALSGAGDRASAFTVYAELRTGLADELGVDPCASLRATYLQLLRDGTGEPALPEAAVPGSTPPGAGAGPASAARAGALGRYRKAAVLLTVLLAAVLPARSTPAVQAVASGDAALLQPAQDGGFASTATWSWEDGQRLGTTATGEQWASGHVWGLVDGDHNAGFRLRSDEHSGGVLVALSGTQWKIEGSEEGASGSLSPGPDGVLLVGITKANQVSIIYDGSLVIRFPLKGSYPGRGISPSIWQSDVQVRITDIASNAVQA